MFRTATARTALEVERNRVDKKRKKERKKKEKEEKKEEEKRNRRFRVNGKISFALNLPTRELSRVRKKKEICV